MIRRMVWQVSIITALILAGPLIAAAGPFGLSQGMTKAEVEAFGVTLTESSLHYYSASKLPKPHRNFEDYQLLIDPDTGLAKIHTVGVTLSSNSYGDAIKTRFRDIEEALTKKYGKGQKFDFLRYDSIWDEPNDWMMGLSLKERTLVHFWDEDLPDGLQTIMLEAKGLSSRSGYVNLGYEFTNSDAAVDRIREAENEGF